MGDEGRRARRLSRDLLSMMPIGRYFDDGSRNGRRVV